MIKSLWIKEADNIHQLRFIISFTNFIKVQGISCYGKNSPFASDLIEFEFPVYLLNMDLEFGQ